MIVLRVLGVMLIVVGLVLSFAPTLVHDPEAAPDLFEAIERHVRWGLPVGIGWLLVWRTQLRPWSETIAATVLSVSLGYLVARILGIIVEGAGSRQQWLYVAVELVVCGLAAAFLWRRRARARGAASSRGGEETV